MKICVTGLPRQDFDPQPLQLLERTFRGVGMQRRQQARPGLDQDDARSPRVRDSEILRDDIHRQLLDGPGKLHAGRTAADDDEMRGAPPARPDPTRLRRPRTIATSASG